MDRIEVVTDSASDLPPEVVSTSDVTIVPLTIRFGDEELRDRVELSSEDFWGRCESEGASPETAAPAPGDFQEAFLAAAERGAAGVVCVNLSSSLSATYQSAFTAAEAVHDRVPVAVVDSRSATMGEGLLVLHAIRAARAGLPLQDVERAVCELIPLVKVWGSLDTLEYLRRGGRIGGAQALLGSLLAIKPTIVLRDGKVEAGPRQRTRARALRQLIEIGRATGRVERVALVHARARDIEEITSMAKETWPDAEITVSELGPVIGTHTGPGTIGLCLQLAGLGDEEGYRVEGEHGQTDRGRRAPRECQ